MKTKNKPLIISISIIAFVLLVGIVLAIVLIPTKITANHYFKSLTTSNHTKQIQTTLIIENNTVLYEKTETMVLNGGKIYHKIETKTISQLNSDYDQSTEEFYYANNKIYYFENNQWKTSDFNLNNQLNSYNLKSEYFNTLIFDKKIKETGNLTGEVKPEHIKEVFGTSSNLKSASLKISVNNHIKAISCKISGLNQTNKYVEIVNSYSYNKETVTLPI